MKPDIFDYLVLLGILLGLLSVSIAYNPPSLVSAESVEAEARGGQLEAQKQMPVRTAKKTDLVGVVLDDAVQAKTNLDTVCILRLQVEGHELYYKTSHVNLGTCLGLRKDYRIQVIRHDLTDGSLFYTWGDGDYWSGERLTWAL